MQAVTAVVTLAVLVSAMAADHEPQHPPEGHNQKPKPEPKACTTGDIRDVTQCHYDAKEALLRKLDHMDKGIDDLLAKCLKDNGCDPNAMSSNNWWDLIADSKLREFGKILNTFADSMSRDMAATFFDESINNFMGIVEDEIRNDAALKDFSFGIDLKGLPFASDKDYKSPQYVAFWNSLLTAQRAARNICPASGDSLNKALQCIRQQQASFDVFKTCIAESQTCKIPECSAGLPQICDAITNAIETASANVGKELIPVCGGDNEEDAITIMNQIQEEALERGKSDKVPSPSADKKLYDEEKAVAVWRGCKAYEELETKQDLGKLLVDYLLAASDLTSVCGVNCARH